MIAVWGSPGSGKTTTAIKLALNLSKNKKNVIVIFDDVFCPSIPVLFPLLDRKEKSIGKVLTSPSMDQKIILENLISPIEDNPYIAFLGYAKGENPLTYAEYTQERATDFFILLKHLADYIIVDCSSVITESIITPISLEMADEVIRLSTANFKGISYFNSTLPLLMDQKFKTDEHLKIISNVRNYQAEETVNSVIKGSGIYIPYVDEIERQYIEGNLFEDLKTKFGKTYEKVIQKIQQKIQQEVIN